MQHALSISALFQGCDIDQKLFTLRKYPKHRMIDDTLNGAAYVGLIVSGSVDVYSVAADGGDIHLNTLHVGECFGIYNLMARIHMQTILHCGENSLIAYISKADLLGLMEQDQRLAFQYARLCNEKMQFLLCRIELLTTQTARYRLAHFLLTQRNREGEISFSHSPEILARHLGMSRATLFRELSFFQQKGLLLRQNRAYLLPDARALEQFMLSSSV